MSGHVMLIPATGEAKNWHTGARVRAVAEAALVAEATRMAEAAAAAIASCGAAAVPAGAPSFKGAQFGTYAGVATQPANMRTKQHPQPIGSVVAGDAADPPWRQPART